MNRRILIAFGLIIFIIVVVGIWSESHDPNAPSDEESVFVEQLKNIHRKMEVMEPGPDLDELHKEKIKIIRSYRAFMREKSSRGRAVLRTLGKEGISVEETK